MKFGENRVELLIDNAKAWPAITRAPLPKGQSHPRIRHFYKFWSCLDQMSVYWDTSLDNQPSPKDRKWNENVIGYKGRRVAAGTEMPERIREDAVKAFLQAACADFGLRVL